MNTGDIHKFFDRIYGYLIFSEVVVAIVLLLTEDSDFLLIIGIICAISLTLITGIKNFRRLEREREQYEKKTKEYYNK